MFIPRWRRGVVVVGEGVEGGGVGVGGNSNGGGRISAKKYEAITGVHNMANGNLKTDLPIHEVTGCRCNKVLYWFLETMLYWGWVMAKLLKVNYTTPNSCVPCSERDLLLMLKKSSFSWHSLKEFVGFLFTNNRVSSSYDNEYKKYGATNSAWY